MRTLPTPKHGDSRPKKKVEEKAQEMDVENYHNKAITNRKIARLKEKIKERVEQTGEWDASKEWLHPENPAMWQGEFDED